MISQYFQMINFRFEIFKSRFLDNMLKFCSQSYEIKSKIFEQNSQNYEIKVDILR